MICMVQVGFDLSVSSGDCWVSQIQSLFVIKNHSPGRPSLAPKQQGTTYPFRATRPFNQLQRKGLFLRLFAELHELVVQAMRGDSFTSVQVLSPVSLSQGPGLYKKFLRQIVLVFKQPSACPLVWPSLL